MGHNFKILSWLLLGQVVQEDVLMCVWLCEYAYTRRLQGGKSVKSRIDKSPFSSLAIFTGCDEQLLLWGQRG